MLCAIASVYELRLTSFDNYDDYGITVYEIEFFLFLSQFTRLHLHLKIFNLDFCVCVRFERKDTHI